MMDYGPSEPWDRCSPVEKGLRIFVVILAACVAVGFVYVLIYA